MRIARYISLYSIQHVASLAGALVLRRQNFLKRAGGCSDATTHARLAALDRRSQFCRCEHLPACL